MPVRPVPQVDVLIVVALDLEYDAVRLVNEAAAPQSTWDERTDLHPKSLPVSLRTFVSQDGHERIFAVACAGKTGKVAATNLAARLIPIVDPAAVAMSGVCAGRRKKTELGDVIVANYTWQFDLGAMRPRLKADETIDAAAAPILQTDDPGTVVEPPWDTLLKRYRGDGVAKRLVSKRPRPLAPQMDWAIRTIARAGKLPIDKAHLPNRDEVLEQLWNRSTVGWLHPRGLNLTEAGRAQAEYLEALYPEDAEVPKPRRSKPALHWAPIASSDRVIHDERQWKDLTGRFRNVLGLEMEVAAIASEAKSCGLPWFAFKGVMDHAALDKDDRMKKFAAWASAEYLVDFVLSIPDAKFPRRKDGACKPQMLARAPLPTKHRTSVFEGRRAETDALVALWNRDMKAWHEAHAANQRVAAVEDTSRVPAVVVLTGWGGVGKTTVVAHLEDAIKKSCGRRIEQYFEWSFYTQGRIGGGGTLVRCSSTKRYANSA